MPGLYKVSVTVRPGDRAIISTIYAPDPQSAINQSKIAHKGRYSRYRAENWDDPTDAANDATPAEGKCCPYCSEIITNDKCGCDRED